MSNILYIFYLCTLKFYKDKRFVVFFLLLFSYYYSLFLYFFCPRSMDSTVEQLYSTLFFILTRREVDEGGRQNMSIEGMVKLSN